MFDVKEPEFTTEMLNIFISYAREDSEAAGSIYACLKSNGFRAWLDIEDLSPGTRWKAEVSRQIAASDFFIAILSTHSITKKGYVQKELRMALDVLAELPENDVFLIPVRLNECQPSQSMLNELNWLDLFPSRTDGMDRLLRFLRSKSTELPSPQAGSRSPLSDLVSQSGFGPKSGLGSKSGIGPKSGLGSTETGIGPKSGLGSTKTGIGPKPRPGFADFEGIWKSDDVGSLYCMRIIDDRILVPYSYGHRQDITGHYFDCRVEAGILFARFEWFKRNIAGCLFLGHENKDLLAGGWWYQRAIPPEIDSNLAMLRAALPGMKTFTLLRSDRQDGFPVWAIEYFDRARSLAGETLNRAQDTALPSAPNKALHADRRSAARTNGG